MPDEAPDKEDEYGSNDGEGQFSPYIIFLVSPCNFWKHVEKTLFSTKWYSLWLSNFKLIKSNQTKPFDIKQK